MDKIADIVTIVTTIGSAIVSLIGVRSGMTEKKRIREYYKKVVLPFVDEYKKGDNEGRNWCKFVSCHIKCTDECIPPYIQYLVGKKDDVQLQAVLLNDAFEYYNNKQFGFGYYYSAILNLVIYITMIGTIIGMVFSVLFVGMGILLFVIQVLVQYLYKISLDLGFTNIVELTVSYAMAFGFCYVLYKLEKGLIEDDYTHNLTKIRKIIKRKIRRTNEKIYGVFFESVQ